MERAGHKAPRAELGQTRVQGKRVGSPGARPSLGWGPRAAAALPPPRALLPPCRLQPQALGASAFPGEKHLIIFDCSEALIKPFTSPWAGLRGLLEGQLPHQALECRLPPQQRWERAEKDLPFHPVSFSLCGLHPRTRLIFFYMFVCLLLHNESPQLGGS